MNRVRLGWASAFMFLCANLCLSAQAWVVRPDGIGPIHVGMKLSELKTRLHVAYSLDFAQDSDQEQCFYAALIAHPGISLMIVNGRVGRVDVDNQVTRTREGIRVGDTEAVVKRKYGNRLKITPHAYIENGGHYLTIYEPGGRTGIRFETDGSKVLRYYSGLRDPIQYIEGCE